MNPVVIPLVFLLAVGTSMHRSASRLARTLQEADPQAALEAIGEWMTHCHSSYRLR